MCTLTPFLDSKAMSTQHSPGPWKVASTYAQAQKGHSQIITWADQGLPLATVKPLHLDPSESNANAHLMAAAPELLAALAGLLEWSEHQAAPGTENIEPHRTARAAIMKATG
jgi:hypothetical protein